MKTPEPEMARPPQETEPAEPEAPVERLRVEVLDAYPHDPRAFTQGLLWHEGVLYESTGLHGRSELRRVVPESGTVLERRAVTPELFAEGLARVGERLIQLTWQSGIALVYRLDDLELIDRLTYDGEGWGLTHDGERLIRSDGSDLLTFHAPDDLAVTGSLRITLDGRPLYNLNELEWAHGRIYANLWQDERIARIDPATGRVDALIDATGLLSPAERRAVDVLNGIAHDPARDDFWLTGKYWPKIFRVRFVPSD